MKKVLLPQGLIVWFLYLERDERFSRWKQAVERSMHWVPAEPASGKLFNLHEYSC